MCVSHWKRHTNKHNPLQEMCPIYCPHHTPSGRRRLQLALAEVGSTQKLIRRRIPFKVHLQTRCAYLQTTQLKTQKKRQTKAKQNTYLNLIHSYICATSIFYISCIIKTIQIWLDVCVMHIYLQNNCPNCRLFPLRMSVLRCIRPSATC